jgi:hypothetical protein
LFLPGLVLSLREAPTHLLHALPVIPLEPVLRFCLYFRLIKQLQHHSTTRF